MEKHARKLLVVITEAAIERNVVADARRLGALGYTAIEVRGGGLHGDREGSWEADRSVELQFICSEPVAERIAERVLAEYAKHYAVAVYLGDVQVFRAEKY